ncbi:AAA family ATPase [Kitasatospora phosalacinea]|uniref:AAA family ATPase n=1 Tax=Kitasatospora phosalacinea TaxID=2065 RepID=A0ABW6GLK5_9ACTN
MRLAGPADRSCGEPPGIVPGVDPDLHFLHLDGARALYTSQVEAVLAGLERAAAAESMMCVSGPAGCGKTFAVHAALTTRCDLAAHHVPLRSNPGAEDIRTALHHTLAPDKPRPKDPLAADTAIRATLRTHLRVLVFDEAHQISDSGFEYIRYLYDDLDTRLCVVLIEGQKGHGALRRQQMLHSRTAAWLHLTALPPDEARHAVPALHPLWHNTPIQALESADARYARGNLRRWAALTDLALRVMARTGHTDADEAFLHRLIDRLDTTLAPRPRRP